jgi:cell division protein FtsZ
VGENETGKLGAGARPEIGAAAVDESRSAVERAIRPYDMIFITAGMGGGTGTGGAPVVASIAQELGILTVGIVTRPFECEGPRRVEAADRGIQELRTHADTLLVVPNERLLDMAGQHTSLVKAFEMADEVLYDATRGISDLITYEGLVNLDFADVETTMKDGGVALLGMSTEFDLRQRSVSSPRARPVGDGAPARTGDAGAVSGGTRTEEAAMEAVSSPLFGTQSIRGADRVLVNVTGGPSLGIRDATSALERIQAEAGDGCNVIFGAVVDEAMKGKFQVTVVATGLDDPSEEASSTEARSDAAPSTGGSNGAVRRRDAAPEKR